MSQTRVLIVDDKTDALYLLRTLLQAHGFEVAEARHGAEALTKARERPPDLVVSDLLMPVMDGYSLLHRWKADERLRAIPFVVYTATYTDAKDERLALDLGADAFILKPTEPEPFMERVTNVLAKARAGELSLARAPWSDEPALLREYSQVLIRKLEEKAVQLEEANRELQRDVAQRRRTEEALRASEERYRTLVAQSPDGIFLVDLNGRFLSVNDAICRELGYSEPEMLTMSLWDVVAEKQWDTHKARLARILKGESLDDAVEYEVRDKAGRRIQVEVRSAPYREGGRIVGFQAMARNVTERKRGEEERRRLAAAIEQSAEAVVITDPEGTILYTNPAFEWITGYGAGEVAGMNPRVLKSGRHAPVFYAEMWATIARGAVWVGRLTNRRKDGRLYEEEMSISPIRDAHGTIINFVAVKRDVTHEIELRQQLNQAQKMEAIGRLAGGIAHDFNNLLQAMMSQVQLVRSNSEAPGTVRGLSDELDRQIGRGASLTRQLLLFSRRGTVKRERLDLNDAVRDAATMLQRLVRADITMRLELAPEALPVEADRGQIDQVLMNLALNASDAMPDGGRIAIRTGSDAGRNVWLEVEDTGQGIPEEIRERIFEPFFTTKAAGKGTGLGLSVVHGIVTQHGGRIEVESAPGRGTTFRLQLPRVGSGEVLAATGAPAAPAEPPRGRGERILIVEDEDVARRGLEGILAGLGYAVVGVHSGEDAEALPDEPAFDVLLTDLVLPGAVGPAVAARLKQRWPALRVILMSGYAEDEAVRLGVSGGTVRFLQKPFGVGALARELRSALD